ncbi:hypothetical protein SynBIOSE41_00996 [Synechococcus sp. BIOS-E4-1]|uniref:hypothetical protein n=1 Tax=Synechococcus sp. BIOS-E4-1 TaxID=1400864 RepID=UPI00164666FA|nr:hypothetical protein [Synechococcus sp. BIOS-E4-1]QNI53521.1 hypothetical protein SynBIOSE41_00996 [Synechococcus sp. BIOS-E4-1]
MQVTYTKLQLDAAGQTELLEQTGDQTMVAKQGETSFAIHGQDGKASTAVDQKWHMISAEQVGESGSVIWQNADTGAFRETKYSINQTNKSWTQTEVKHLATPNSIYKVEENHNRDINNDGTISASTLNLQGPMGDANDRVKITLNGQEDLIAKTTVGTWNTDRKCSYQLSGRDAQSFQVNANGRVSVKKGTSLEAGKSYEFAVEVKDNSTETKKTQNVELKQRALIMVTNNNGDNSEGSLGKAIEKANENGKKGIASEIRFSKSMYIEQTEGLHVTHGDTVFNVNETKNITITRKDDGPAITVGEYKYANKTPLENAPDLHVSLAKINVANTTAKGSDGLANGGGGGGLGAGSAILHFNGHLKVHDSVFQGNNVIGGEGAVGAKGGNGRAFAYSRKNRSTAPQNGQPGRNGGTLNGREHSLNRKEIAGGKKGVVQSHGGLGFHRPGPSPMDHDGRRGSDATSTSNLGEAAPGSGSGGGGEYVQANHQPLFQSMSPGSRGYAGQPGRPGTSGYGAGESIKGTVGGSAIWHTTDGWKGIKRYGYNIKVTPSTERGKAGTWGGNAESYSDNPNDKFNAPEPGKSGNGAALGVVSSLARANGKNSVEITESDFRGNKAESSKSAGKVKGMFMRSVEAKIDDVRESDDKQSSAVNLKKVQGITKNADPNGVDKSKIFDHSGKFTTIEKKEGRATSFIVKATSYEKDETKANIRGKEIYLNPDIPQLIISRTETGQSNVNAHAIDGWQNWQNALTAVGSKIYATKSVEEIKASRRNFAQNWINSVMTPGKMHAPNISSMWGPAVAHTMKAWTVVGGFWGALMTELKEDQRIKDELKAREVTIKEHEAYSAQIRNGLHISDTQKDHSRTITTTHDFKLGTHGVIFQPGQDAILKWGGKNDQNKGIINVYHNQYSSNSDVANAKQIMRFVLTKEQTEAMRNTTNKTEYINSFLSYVKIGATAVKVFSTKSAWKYKENASQDPQTGVGRDQVEIRRDKTKVDDRTNLVVATHQGDDVVKGDKGDSTIRAGRGNDHITPGLGVDHVDGGEGRDVASYSNINKGLKIRAGNDGNLKVSFANSSETAIMNDTLTGIETIILGDKADINLQGASRPVEYSTLDPARTTNVASHYALAMGHSSKAKGSQYNEVFVVDFESTTKHSDSIKKTTIDGAGGRNSLIIKGLDSQIKNGYKVSIDRTKKEVNLVKENDKKTIVGYQNVMGDPTVITKDNQVFEPEFNPSKPVGQEVKKVDPSVSPLTKSDAEPTTASASASASASVDQPMMVDSLTGNTGESASNVTGTAPQLKGGTDSLTGETMTNADSDSSDWTPMHQDAGLSEGSVNHSGNLLAAHSNGINSNNEFNTHPETLSVLDVDPIATSIAGKPVISDPFEAVGANATYRSTSTPAGVIEMV